MPIKTQREKYQNGFGAGGLENFPPKRHDECFGRDLGKTMMTISRLEELGNVLLDGPSKCKRGSYFILQLFLFSTYSKPTFFLRNFEV